MNREEAKIQSECFIWFNNTYCLKFHEPRGLMFSIPNELGGRNAISTALAKSTGLTSGVSDTIVILPSGRLIFVEFKTSTGVQSTSQKEFEQRVKAHGYDYYIVRSLKKFKEIIN